MRAASLGNGRVLVNLDEHGQVIDLYYPYAGMENQTGGKSQSIGIRRNENFYWLEDKPASIRYLDNTMILQTEWSTKDLKISSLDFVSRKENIFVRIFRIQNQVGEASQLSLFFYNDLDIYGSKIGDTAMFDPRSKSVVHYKSKRYVGYRAFTIDRETFTRYILGKPGLKESLINLSDSSYPIAQGDVESVGVLDLSLQPGEVKKVYLLYVLSKNLEGLRELIRRVDITYLENELTTEHSFWSSWIGRARGPKADFQDAFRVSLLILRAHMGLNGSLIASSDYSFAHLYGDTYNYIWPRDAGYVLLALDMAGYGEIVMKSLEMIGNLSEGKGFLLHKYNPNGTLASSWHPWLLNGVEILPIQEDETAIPVWVASLHYMRYRDIDQIAPLYSKLIRPAMRFMMDFVEDGLPKPSFDLWEERYGIHLFTTSSVYGALMASSVVAKDMGDETLANDAKIVAKQMKEETKKRLVADGRLVRRLDEAGNQDLTVDSSLYGSFFFGMFEPTDPIVVKTMSAVEQRLSSAGGILRYEGDPYRSIDGKPNPWLICTLWLSEYYSLIGDRNRASSYIRWVVNRSVKAGLLPEQVSPNDLTPTSVVPLVWTHAEVVISSLLHSGGISIRP